jgi:hypothetical protein
MGSTYNIIRAKKYKSKTQIERSARHNFRIGTQHKNVYSQKSHLNKLLVNTLDVDITKARAFGDAMDAFYAEKNIKIKQAADKERQQVLMLEVVATASHDFFKGMTVDQVEEWANHYIEGIKNEFGGENVKMAILHLDEKTPHVHVYVTPEEKKTVVYKNKDPKTGETREYPKARWSLNAKRWNPDFMSQLQTNAHQWMSKHYPKLERGVKGSTREHVDQKEFYSEQAKAMKTTSNFGEITKKAIDGLDVKKIPLVGDYVKLDDVMKVIDEKLEPAYNRVKFIETMTQFTPNALNYKSIKDRKKKLDEKERKLDEQEEFLQNQSNKILTRHSNFEDRLTEKDKIIASQAEQLNKANEKIGLLEKIIDEFESLKEKFIPGYKTRKQQQQKI